MSKLDLTGQSFGRLIVVGTGARSKKGRSTWRCKCECGNTKDVETSRLLSGNNKSCGCLKKIAGENVKAIQQSQNVDSVQVASLKRKVNKNSTTGVKGVTIRKGFKKPYCASISIKGERIDIGRFETLEEAVKARKKAEEIYHLPYLEKLKSLGKN